MKNKIGKIPKCKKDLKQNSINSESVSEKISDHAIPQFNAVVTGIINFKNAIINNLEFQNIELISKLKITEKEICEVESGILFHIHKIRLEIYNPSKFNIDEISKISEIVSRRNLIKSLKTEIKDLLQRCIEFRNNIDPRVELLINNKL